MSEKAANRPLMAVRGAAGHPLAAVRVEPATLPWLTALAAGDDVFTAQFGIPVAPGWAVFAEAIPRALEAAKAGQPAAWGTHLFFDADGALAGIGGWKGEPVDGVAELGYAVAPERRGRGIATAVVRELVARARAIGLRLVVAHTVAETSASTAVLQRCGFTRVAEVVDPDIGVLWRWERCLGLIYHLALHDEWEAAAATGAYRRSTLGKSLEEQGFIHCSFDSQVQATADLIYRGRSDVLLLTIDTSRLRSEVRVESVDGGTNRFPHIYGPLPVDAVVQVQALPIADDGRLLLAAVLTR